MPEAKPYISGYNEDKSMCIVRFPSGNFEWMSVKSFEMNYVNPPAEVDNVEKALEMIDEIFGQK